MKQRNRYILLFAVLLALLALSACGASPEEAEKQEPEAVETSADVSSISEEIKESEEADEGAEESEQETEEPEAEGSVWDFEAEPVEISVMSFFASDNLEVEQGVVDAFEEAYPNIKVSYENISFSDYFTVVTTLAAGNDLPDVLAMNFEEEARYADLGVLEDLTPFIEKENFNLDKYYASTVRMHQHSGIQAGLPATFSIVINFYNKTMFDEAGIPYPTEDWTWDDLVDAAQKMTQDVDGDGIIDQFGYVVGWWPNFVYQNEGTILNEEGRCGLTSPEAIEGLQLMVDLTLDPEQKIAPDRAELSASGDWDRFMAGGVGILPNGTWAITPFKENIEDSFEWDVMPFISFNKQATFMFGNAYSMTSTSKQKEAAWEFIKFATGEEGSRIRQAGEYETSPVKAVGAKDFIESTNGVPEHAEYFLDATEYAILPVAHPLWGEIHGIIWPELELALLGEQGVEEAMTAACDGVDTLLEENGY